MPDGLRAVMRRVFLAGSFIVLVAALAVMWNHRYERMPGLPDWNLADLRQGVPGVPGAAWAGTPEDPVPRLRVDGRNPRVALRLTVPGAPVVESLHLKFRLTARGLTPGKERWETGRLMIEWHPPAGASAVEKDPVGGIKHDLDSGKVSLVAVPLRGPAVPAIVLEHLGREGEFELSELQIIPVRERGQWKTGRWVLGLAAFAWLAACIRSWRGVQTWRASAAAAICLLMVIGFVIPGPWKVQRSLVVPDFLLAESAQPSASGETPLLVEAMAVVAISSGAIQPSGEVRVQGGAALRARDLLRHLRLLLHVALLAAPTLAFAILLGRRNAVRLAIPLALAIECAQAAFGYGFDWLDAVDLIFDGLGIWLALRVHRRLARSLTLLDPVLPSATPPDILPHEPHTH
jgi:hypothetical protein